MVASVWFSRSIFTPFLGLHRLVQPIGPAASRHQAAGELIDDEHLAVFHHVLHVALVQVVGLNRHLHVVLQVPVFRVGDVVDAQQLLDFFPSLLGDRRIAVLLVDHEVAGQRSFVGLRAGKLFALLQLAG